MLCVISFIFIFVVIAQAECGSLTSGQALFYGFYGLIMLHHTSKKYWDYDRYIKEKGANKNGK
ncbi:MAG: hypothetical protein HFJ48_06275 [Clostridia bacterium]|nr:hypothetical protein [Clostridia bacterium]